MIFTSLGLPLKRIARSETFNLSIWVVLAGLVVAAAASLYYTMQIPEHAVEEEVLLTYEQLGHYDYTAHLKPNTVYSTTELGPQETYFAALVESMEMTFAYSLMARSNTGESISVPEEGMIEYEIVAILREGDLWQREHILVPRSLTTNSSVEARFHLPIQTYQEEAEAVLAEVKTPGRDLQLQVMARFWPLVTTPYGTIDTPFVHEMSFKWEGAELLVSGQLEQQMADVLADSISVPDRQRALYMRLSLFGVVLSLLLVAAWAVVSRWAAHTPYTAKELQSESRRLYGEMLVEAVALPPPLPNQVVVPLRSLDDVGRAARELMIPIIVVSERDTHRYVVIDGEDNVRYEFQMRIERAAKSGTRDDGRIGQDHRQPSPVAHDNGRADAPFQSPPAGELETNRRMDATAIQQIPMQIAQHSSISQRNHNHHLP